MDYPGRTSTRELPRPAALLVLTIGLTLALFFQPALQDAQAASFTDVSDSHRYRLPIEILAEMGVIAGYGDGRFGPDAPVNRQQFAKMVVNAMRIPVSESDVSIFVDVDASGPNSLFPDNYVAAVYREGITNGTRTNPPSFSPYNSIALAQMVTMTSRASGRELVEPPSSYPGLWGNFSSVHASAARLAQYNGLLRELSLPAGDPWRAATRAEAAAILFNLMGTDPLGLNGRFLGTSDDLVRYFAIRGRDDYRFTVSLKQLAEYYIGYGRAFGIRADTAWAQMVHETNFGEYTGDVQPEQNNMAGIGATGGGVPGNSFATAQHGVVAHIAHLAWYVYPTHIYHPWCRMSTWSGEFGDPRHFVVDGLEHRGNVRTVLDLGGKWAPSPTYGNAVLGHQQQIPVSVGLW